MPGYEIDWKSTLALIVLVLVLSPIYFVQFLERKRIKREIERADGWEQREDARMLLLLRDVEAEERKAAALERIAIAVERDVRSDH